VLISGVSTFLQRTKSGWVKTLAMSASLKQMMRQIFNSSMLICSMYSNLKLVGMSDISNDNKKFIYSSTVDRALSLTETFLKIPGTITSGISLALHESSKFT
jgi:hypothetical protein